MLLLLVRPGTLYEAQQFRALLLKGLSTPTKYVVPQGPQDVCNRMTLRIYLPGSVDVTELEMSSACTLEWERLARTGNPFLYVQGSDTAILNPAQA